MFKDPNFKYECEHRISLSQPHNIDDSIILKKLDFITTKNNIKPVLKIDNFNDWNNLITDVIISPYNTSKIIKNSIYDFLNFNDLLIKHNNIIKIQMPN